MVKTSSIGARAIRFLDEHGLDHSPDHYAFAHRYLSGQDRDFADAVKQEIEGGIRLREEAVRALMPGDTGRSATADFGALATELLGLLTNTASATGDLNRDLVRTAAALVSAEPPRVRKLVVFMIERTAETEASLSAALRRAQALRRVEEEVLREHVAHCVEHAIASGDKADQRQKIAELMDVIRRADR